MGMESALCYPEESNARVLFAVWKSHFHTLPHLHFLFLPSQGRTTKQSKSSPDACRRPASSWESVGAVFMLPKLTATNKNTEERKDCLYPSCLRDWGQRLVGRARRVRNSKAILLSQWEAGWKWPGFLASCHQVMRKLHDQ